MIKEAICTAASIDEAKAAAIAQLNAPEDSDVTIEVLEIPVKKTLGIFGGTLAKVRAYYEQSDYSRAEAYIRTILTGMGITDAKILIEDTGEDINIQLDCGDDYGTVIGRRGETLDAIQYLTRLIISKDTDGYKRVFINIGNYRERRENTLREIARKNAERVKKYGRNLSLDPMNPYERRIIHTTIQEIEGVDSHSVGADSDRRVVISLAEGFKATHGNFNSSRPQHGYSNDGKNRRNTDSKERTDFRQKPNKPSAGSVPHTPRSDSASTSLYGKIEPKKQ